MGKLKSWAMGEQERILSMFEDGDLDIIDAYNMLNRVSLGESPGEFRDQLLELTEDDNDKQRLIAYSGGH